MAGTLDHLIEGARQRRWLGDPASLRSIGPKAPIQKQEAKELVTQFEDLLVSDRVTADHLLFSGLIVAEPLVISEIQSRGVFRLSRNFCRPNPSTETARRMAASSHLSDRVREYFTSIMNMHTVGEALRVDYDVLRAWLNAERESGIKGVLATLDWIFLQETHAATRASPDPWAEDPESLASGFSAILAIYFDLHGPLRCAPTFEATEAAQQEYLAHLCRGARIAEYRGWEIDIDAMGYRLQEEEPGSRFLLSAPSQEFQQARELGFIHSYAQRVLAMAIDDESSAETFRGLAQALAEKGMLTRLAKVVHEPRPRVRFELPEPILAMLRDVGDLTREERFALRDACADLLVSRNKLLDFKIQDDVTMRDVFLVWRLLQFVRALVAVVLLKEAEEDQPLALQSLIPVMRHDSLAKFFGYAVDEGKAAAVINLLMTDPDEHIDVQYRPLISAGPEVMIPINLLASSNMLRNVLVICRKRIYADGREDPLSRNLAAAFREKGFVSKANIPFALGAVAGEVDVLTAIDDVVLALECKNSLLPTGSHELRTSLDYIATAAKQLSRLRTCFEDRAVREGLARRCGFSISADTRLVTGIVMANRMLIGYRVDGHAVRGHFELVKFLRDGMMSIGDESVPFWRSEKLSGEDIRRFFEDDITYEPQWKAMETDRVRWELHGGCCVDVERSGINQLSLARLLGLSKAEAVLSQHDRAMRSLGRPGQNEVVIE